MENKRHGRKKSTVFLVLLLEAAAVLCIYGVLFRFSAIRTALYNFTLPAVKSVDMSGLNSPCAILISARGGRVIGEVNGEDLMYPASLTKMMTVIIGLEKLDQEEDITFTSDMLSPLAGSDATQAGFQAGETAKVRDVLYGALLPSGADCCMAIACSISGSEEEFASLMNRKAAGIGMKNTQFRNSTGLHDEEHYSTAHDMAVLLKYCLKNKSFREIITSRYYSTAPTNLHPEGITFYSTMFKNLSSAEVTNGEILGGKTGFTNAAGLCLASFALVGGREYILVTAGAPGDTGEPLHVRDALEVYNRAGEQVPSFLHLYG